jgi:predicted amino acid dehydrogenase
MEYLLVYGVTALAASGGWIVWGAARWIARRRKRAFLLALTREREQTERRRLELEAQRRELEIANEVYQDFVRRHPDRRALS